MNYVTDSSVNKTTQGRTDTRSHKTSITSLEMPWTRNRYKRSQNRIRCALKSTSAQLHFPAHINFSIAVSFLSQHRRQEALLKGCKALQLPLLTSMGLQKHFRGQSRWDEQSLQLSQSTAFHKFLQVQSFHIWPMVHKLWQGQKSLEYLSNYYKVLLKNNWITCRFFF